MVLYVCINPFRKKYVIACILFDKLLHFWYMLRRKSRLDFSRAVVQEWRRLDFVVRFLRRRCPCLIQVWLSPWRRGWRTSSSAPYRRCSWPAAATWGRCTASETRPHKAPQCHRHKLEQRTVKLRRTVNWYWTVKSNWTVNWYWNANWFWIVNWNWPKTN